MVNEVNSILSIGIPNFLLVNENKKLAKTYKKKSVAEQNSVDLAWKVFMEPRFTALRNCIYTSPEELNRFRALIVNTVLATEIFDRELQTLRKKRWDNAFSEHDEDEVHRKATVVLEHLMQASDVAHTMQDWETYQKWN